MTAHHEALIFIFIFNVLLYLQDVEDALEVRLALVERDLVC